MQYMGILWPIGHSYHPIFQSQKLTYIKLFFYRLIKTRNFKINTIFIYNILNEKDSPSNIKINIKTQKKEEKIK